MLSPLTAPLRGLFSPLYSEQASSPPPGGGTGDPLLDPLPIDIVATWNGDNTDTTPEISLSFGDLAISDVIYELRSLDNWTTFTYDTITVTSVSPVIFSPTTFSFGAWAYGNWKTRFLLSRASVLTYMSNDEPVYIDITAPVITSPLGVATGQTTADVSCGCTEAITTRYYIIREAVAPAADADQIQLGHDSTDTPAIAADDASYTTSGTKTLNVTGLTSNTDYQVDWVAIDAAGNVSSVVTSATFTTTGSSQRLLEGGTSKRLLEGGTSKRILEG